MNRPHSLAPLLCLTALACSPAQAPSPSMPATPWTIEDCTPSTEDGIRILVIHDMEGLSGQSDPRSFMFSSDLYPMGQEWLAGDVNAVVDGLFAGGATEVLIADGHGSGNPEPDLRSDLLDERATQIIRDERFNAYFDLPETETVDGVAVVGMHARTGSGGFASHTFTRGIEIRINGQAITETEVIALSWGRFGVPVIFASGDDHLENDLETMPWIEFVRVKDATAADSAVLRPVEEARADLRSGAQRAVENLARAKSMRAATPVYASLHAVPPASLAFLDGIPGLDHHDGTLTFAAADFREAFDGLIPVIGLATRGYASVLQEVIDSRDDAEEISSAYREALNQRWFDQESGRYQPPEPASDSAPRRRFFGFR